MEMLHRFALLLSSGEEDIMIKIIFSRQIESYFQHIPEFQSRKFVNIVVQKFLRQETTSFSSHATIEKVDTFLMTQCPRFFAIQNACFSYFLIF